MLVYLSVKSISADDWQVIKQAVGKTQWLWIIVSLLCAVLSHVIRAIRWKQMLDTISPTNLANLFSAQATGYLVNMALPRVGEATRAGIVSRTEKISIDKVVGTIFNDRILDVIILLAITAIAILLQYNIIGSYTIAIYEAVLTKIENINYLMLLGVLFLIGVVAYFLSAMFKQLWQKVLGIFKNIWEGVSAIWLLENKFLFVFYSIFIWFMYFLMIFLCMQSMEFTSDLSSATALVLLAFGTWGFLITPGGIGAYPIVIANILVLYGKDYNLGIAFGWVIWAAQSMLNLLMGVISVAYLGVKKA